MSFAGYLLIQKATTSPGPTDANIKKKEGRLRFEGLNGTCLRRQEWGREKAAIALAFFQEPVLLRAANKGMASLVPFFSFEQATDFA